MLCFLNRPVLLLFVSFVTTNPHFVDVKTCIIHWIVKFDKSQCDLCGGTGCRRGPKVTSLVACRSRGRCAQHLRRIRGCDRRESVTRKIRVRCASCSPRPSCKCCANLRWGARNDEGSYLLQTFLCKNHHGVSVVSQLCFRVLKGEPTVDMWRHKCSRLV
jgi:hypothetical protein